GRKLWKVLVPAAVILVAAVIGGAFYFHSHLTKPATALTEKDIITFDAPGAGTAAGQGTFSVFINPAGTIVGYYIDSSWLLHGFVRRSWGLFETIDHPNAAKVAPVHYMYGTMIFGIDQKGTIAGQYQDENSLFRGFVSNPPYTTFTTINIPGEGTAKGP